MRRIKISVTADHIDRGIPQNPYSCPVALAIKDVQGGRIAAGKIQILSYLSNVSILEFPTWTTWTTKTPCRVARFIDRFDNNQLVNPFKFWLVIP